DIDSYDQLYQQLPQLRSGIDARAVPAAQVFAAFGLVIDTIVQASLLAAEVAPSAEVSVGLYKAVHALRAGEAVSRAGALGITALLTEQLPPGQLTEFSRYVGDARGEVGYVTAVLTGPRLEQAKAIVAGPDWQRLTAMEDAFIQRGPVLPEDSTARTGSGSGSGSTTGSGSATDDVELPLTAEDWEHAADAVTAQLLKLWEDQSRDSHALAKAIGDDQATGSSWAGAGVAALTLLAFVAAMLLANRFVGRMRRLRRETLQLADERLPETIRQLSAGKEVQPDDMAPLNFGGDEIGQVADAFNRAHAAAVAAAVAEAKTRAGVNAVFLNIAHRSQVMVHRQLVLLDKAEREEEDPDRLDLLFQLDHLATRSRRNAENLVILGGEQPGRKWRNPVPLVELVRSAVAESLDYTRIQTGKLPEVRILGNVVADLIHLIAELTDNATAFSPPESRVEVSGNLVGKGLALEITDQGLGMSEAELAERNALLAEMAAEVCRLVLADNESQNQLMGTARARAVASLAVHGRLIDHLEREYGLDRDLEVLPSKQEIAARRRAGHGLTSPELATLLAHVKLALRADLLAGPLPDDPAFAEHLAGYFPQRLRTEYAEAIAAHPLRREIVPTVLTNDVVDNGGITYAYRLTEESGADNADAVRAFAIVTAVFDLPGLWRDLRGAGLSADLTDELIVLSRRLLDRAARWMLTQRPQPLAVAEEIARFRGGIAELTPRVAGWLSGRDAAALRTRTAALTDRGVPAELAERVALLLDRFALLDIIEVAAATGRPAAAVAPVYYLLGERLGVVPQLMAVSRLERGTKWNALARVALRDELYDTIRALCRDVLTDGEPGESAERVIDDWAQRCAAKLDRTQRILEAISESGDRDLAALSVATRQLRALAR
ncbi:NAD-glutamate dehydrogenase, partial [Nocardia elegans]|uniref:nitrate- and nitrite sensing domain-containing protein n=1 Tax=Nocardia elegans TaxID=300029 RepID=UPI001894F5A7